MFDLGMGSEVWEGYQGNLGGIWGESGGESMRETVKDWNLKKKRAFLQILCNIAHGFLLPIDDHLFFAKSFC